MKNKMHIITESLKRYELSEFEKNRFEKLKEKYSINGDLFITNNNKYRYNIYYKKNNIFYQIKLKNKIIIDSKNIEVIKNKLIKLLEVIE